MSNISDFLKKKLENYDNNVKENIDFINSSKITFSDLKLNIIITAVKA